MHILSMYNLTSKYTSRCPRVYVYANLEWSHACRFLLLVFPPAVIVVSPYYYGLLDVGLTIHVHTYKHTTYISIWTTHIHWVIVNIG